MLKKVPHKKIVIFTTISLLGLILTQSFWIINAIRVGEKQFNHRANIALEDVLDELIDYQDTTLRKSGATNLDHREKPTHIFNAIDTSTLATLIQKYIQYHELDGQFFYQIVKTYNDSVILSSNGSYETPQNIDAHRACLSCLWKEEYFHIALYFPSHKKKIFLELALWLSLSIVFLLIVVGGYVFNVSTIIRQKKISEIKNDFINNMTHEFKTPLSTISIASEVLKKGELDRERINKYADIIFEENQRMQHQVERVLQIAQLEKEDLKLNLEKIEFHSLLKTSIENLCLEHCEKDVVLKYRLNAKNTDLLGDKLHLTNILKNLIDNASKYSGEKPKIEIETKNISDSRIQVKVRDNGIGINQKSIQHIFDKFYRVPTGDVHDVKGFGLGLYYVKTMVEAHHGEVSVHSEINKGSEFCVTLPLKIDKDEL